MDLNILAHKAAYGNRGLTLENLDDDLPEGGDSALGSYAESCDAAFEDSEVQSQALETIRDYSDQLAGMINRGDCTPIALSLLRHNMQTQAQRMGRELVMPALEGIDSISIEAQSTIALESVKNFLNNVVQEFVIGFKHHKDLIGDFLRTTSEITAKYEKKSLENGRHWHDVKKDIDMSQTVSVGANGLYFFFAKGNENPTVGKLLGEGKLLDALKEDVQISKYILTQYPKVVMQEMKSLAAILRGASFKKQGDMVRMVAQVEKLKTPVELFDSKYHNAELLGAANLHAAPNRPRKMQPATSHKPMPRMAEMAGAKHVGYKGSKGMGYLRGFGAVTGAAGATALNMAAPGVGQLAYATGKVATGLPMALATSTKETAYSFPASAIPTILSIAEKYLDCVRGAVGYEREIVRVLDELDAAIERANDSSEALVDAISELKDKEEADKAWSAYIEDCHLFEQVLAFANSLRRALQKPVHGEAARALRAAKYCNYLALRAMFNAERKKVATEDYEEPSPALRAKYEQTKHQYDKLKAEAEHATGARLEAVQAHLSRLSRELRGHDLWPLTVADKHQVALEGMDESEHGHQGSEEEYHQLSAEFKKARDDSHAAYQSMQHSDSKEHDERWADSHKRAAQARHKLAKAGLLDRFMKEHPEHFNGTYRPATESEDVTPPEVPAGEPAVGETNEPVESEDIHTKHAKRMKRLTEAHDQHQKLLRDADSPEKHAPAQEAVKTLVRQMQQALAEYLEQVSDEVAPPPDVE